MSNILNLVFTFYFRIIFFHFIPDVLTWDEEYVAFQRNTYNDDSRYSADKAVDEETESNRFISVFILNCSFYYILQASI